MTPAYFKAQIRRARDIGGGSGGGVYDAHN